MGFRDNIVGNGEDLRRTSQWQLDTTTSPESSEFNISDNYYSPNGLDLYVVQKRERSSSRPIIPATKCEKLTYIRSYVSHSKTEALGVRFIDYNRCWVMELPGGEVNSVLLVIVSSLFVYGLSYIYTSGCADTSNRFFWYYLQGAFLKTLPSCYVYLFIGSYAAQHHLFLTKMAPLLHGLNIVWILIGVLQLYFATYVQVMSLDFIFVGFLNQRPWNRCIHNYYTRQIGNGSFTSKINVSCLTLDQFITRNKNKSFTTSDHYFYEPATHEFVQVSHYFNAKFTCRLNMIPKRNTCINEVRKDLFASKNKLVTSLPPTSAALYKHALRAAYQAGHIWGNTLETDVSIPCPSSWGWTKAQDIWTPDWSAVAAIWSQLSLLDRCGCKSGCDTMRCGCRRVSLQCTAQCKSCKGGCTNQNSTSAVEPEEDI